MVLRDILIKISIIISYPFLIFNIDVLWYFTNILKSWMAINRNFPFNEFVFTYPDDHSIFFKDLHGVI